MTDRTFTQRFRMVGIVLFAVITGLGVRLASLHLKADPAGRQRVSSTRRFEQDLSVSRGRILDCIGRENVLASDMALYDVCADPQIVVKSNLVQQTAAVLNEALGLPAADIQADLSCSTSRYVRIRRHVAPEVARKIESLHLPGVFCPETLIRNYPHGSFMCHLLGFANFEGIGSAGVEQAMDSYLRGSQGVLTGEKNALRQPIYDTRDLEIPAVAGADVALTVDQNIQYMVEKALDDVMKEHRAKAAWVVVGRVHTGEVLALACRPAYDLNEFRTATSNDRLNRAIGSVYEPGSTLKVVAISAALEEGVVTPQTVFDCENGAWSYGGKILRDYHPYGRLTVADGLKKSSNILTAKVALMLGKDRLYKYLTAFGIGEKLGIDVPGEERGILHDVSKWSAISPTRIAIGQGVAVTALQMLSVFSAIANGGELMRPYVISRVTGADGSLLYEGHPEVLSRPLRPETAALMRGLLSRVTEEGGTGKRAQVEGYEVAGKTGTAEKAIRGGYSKTDFVASFVGFLPAANPEVALVVVVDTPQPFHTGGVVAGPTFSRIADQVVRYLDIPPAGRPALARR
jgi:cell division protein FtsI (penicillin-binding protein 3)